MESNKPLFVLASAVTTFVAGGFLMVVHIGADSRETQDMHYNMNVRGAAPAAADYLGDFQRGKAEIKKKRDNFMSGFFGETPQAAALPGSSTASARKEAGPEAGPGSGDDAFERHYSKNFPEGYGARAPAYSGAGSWSDGGGDSASSASGTPPEPVLGFKRGHAGDGLPSVSVVKELPPAQNPSFGGPAAGPRSGAAPKLYASLPVNGGGQGPASRPWDGGSIPPYSGSRTGKAGGLQALCGQASPGALDSADESGRSGADSGYNSKLSGGAASAAASSGGGKAPAASAPQSVSGSGASGAAGAAGSKTGPKAAAPSASGNTADKSFDVFSARDSRAPESRSLLQSVVTDKLNGLDSKYVSAEEGAAAPEEKMLVSGAVSGGNPAAEKTASGAADTRSAAAAGPDPEDLNSLSPERRKELKKGIHVFLKRVENKFGAMADISYTSCETTPAICSDKEITRGYLTMTTSSKAEIVLGLKYIKTRWRRYTVSFKRSPSDPGSDIPANYRRRR